MANSNPDEQIKCILSILLTHTNVIFVVFSTDSIDFLVNQDQIEYFQAFSKLTKDEKAKIMETMTDEEKENFKDLQAEYER